MLVGGVGAVAWLPQPVVFDGARQQGSARLRGGLDTLTPGRRFMLSHLPASERTRLTTTLDTFQPSAGLVRTLLR